MPKARSDMMKNTELHLEITTTYVIPQSYLKNICKLFSYYMEFRQCILNKHVSIQMFLL